MDLKEYINKNDISVGRFAYESGVSTDSLYKFMRKERRPTMRVAYKIIKATHGQVTMEDLRGKVNDN